MSASVAEDWNVVSYARRFATEASDDYHTAALSAGTSFAELGADCEVAVAWANGQLSERRVEPRSGHAALRLGSRTQLSDFESLSGITRIAHPLLGEGSHAQEQTLERFIADQMNLIIAEAVGTGERDTRHLIRGPLIRKLRGRLAYRLIDPRHFTVLSLDWDKRRILERCPRTRAWDKCHSNSSAEVYGPYPSLTLDSGVRSYELVVGKWRYVVEVPLCALPLSTAAEFFREIVPRLVSEIGDAIALMDTGSDAPPLPALLGGVNRAAEQMIRGPAVQDSGIYPEPVSGHIHAAPPASMNRRNTKDELLRTNLVLACFQKYRIAPEDRMSVRAYITDWVASINREQDQHPGLVRAIIEEFNDATLPIVLVAAQPKDIEWVKAALTEVATDARKRLSNAN